MIGAMIISVGGSAEPVAKSISAKDRNPKLVCFLTSHDSVVKLGEIKELTAKAGILYEHKVVIVDDPANLVDCYRKALECVDEVMKEGFEPGQLLVDYTGGTKTMTAGLTLATLGKGCMFSYVSGTERTKDGLGVVISGTEKIVEGIGPWQLFAVEEKRAIELHVNSYRFGSALEIIDNLRRRGENIAGYPYLSPLRDIIVGFQEWEAFRHTNALKNIESGTKRLRERLETVKCLSLKRYLNDVMDNFKFLKTMSYKTSDFNELSEEVVIDLLSNAKRRAENGRFDDAVARVYRSLEMIGQIEFKNKFGCETDNVPLELLPHQFQKHYKIKYSSGKDGNLKLPLNATFEVLNKVNNPVGMCYCAMKKDIQKVQLSRNYSILAHGIKAVSRKAFESTLKIVGVLFDNQETVQFPKLEGDW
ncbi:MAG: TIGR02710 family CRISPR-associated CARF protein [Candidatus Hatepunaea meridiana]|nr:TIGR02710 family CRISPR-associated CARF protein [Candidatus Hatepunaea meridiana]